jgi:Fe-S-cluster containining protein
MKVDQDRPSTWRKYEAKNCTTCFANCCRMPVEVRLPDLVRLGLASEDEAQGSIRKLAKRLVKEGVIKSYREGTEFFMLTQKSNHDCYFLDSVTRLCRVYDQRPDTCRDFPARVGPRLGYCPSQKK